MNSSLKKTISVLTCTILTAIFVVALYFSAPRFAAVPEESGDISVRISQRLPDGSIQSVTVDKTLGKDFAGVRISDLGDIGKLTKVNYIPDIYATPGVFYENMQIVDLQKPFEFAKKGTLIFYIFNLDPNRDDYNEQIDRLEKYKEGDYWKFTLSLPNIFSASNIYYNGSLAVSHGEIENYDYSEFTTLFDKTTDKFVPETGASVLNLQFYTRRQAMDNQFNAAKAVTIHYQSQGTSYSALDGCPLIGTATKIRDISENSQNLLISFAILSLVVFAILGILSLLKRTKQFASAIIWIFGITILLVSAYLLGQTASAPLLWKALTLCMPFIILLGALLSVGRNFKRIPLKIILPAIVGIGALLAFICPFVSLGAATTLNILCIVLKAIGVISLVALIVAEILDKNEDIDFIKSICTPLIAMIIFSSVFIPMVAPIYSNAIFWLYSAAIVTTFVNVFIIFTQTERTNNYLTKNLHLEVERQINDIKSVVQERDNLLQFVSHDMKKPLISATSLVDTLIERETDEEQTKALKIVKQNATHVIANLSEIGKYAKFNYIAEPSAVVNLKHLCASICNFHSFDCTANGIVLKNSVDKNFKVYAKEQGLTNAISNIIMNAVEHANCSAVTLSVKPEKDKIILCISDNGKGIDSSLDVFKAYVSETDRETGGLGLYICKNIIESMNGDLYFESRQGNTVFYISLLKA